MCVRMSVQLCQSKRDKSMITEMTDEIICKMLPVFVQVPGTLLSSLCRRLFVGILQVTHNDGLMETLRLLTALQQ